MEWEYRTETKVTKIDDGVEPSGIAIEYVNLQSRFFGTWAPASVPESTIRDELAKAIADELLYDVEWTKDPRSGYAMGKFSSVVYMKPDMKKMREINKGLEKKISEQHRENTKLKRRIEELENVNSEMASEIRKLDDTILGLQEQIFDILSDIDYFSLYYSNR
jgi:hypothetical protein